MRRTAVLAGRGQDDNHKGNSGCSVRVEHPLLSVGMRVAHRCGFWRRGARVCICYL